MRGGGLGARRAARRSASATTLAPPYDARAVFGAARTGDAVARQVVAEEARRIALHVAPIAAVTDVALVVIGGGIGANGDLLLDPIRALLAKWLPLPPQGRGLDARRGGRPHRRARRSAAASRSTTSSQAVAASGLSRARGPAPLDDLAAAMHDHLVVQVRRDARVVRDDRHPVADPRTLRARADVDEAVLLVQLVDLRVRMLDDQPVPVAPRARSDVERLRAGVEDRPLARRPC